MSKLSQWVLRFSLCNRLLHSEVLPWLSAPALRSTVPSQRSRQEPHLPQPHARQCPSARQLCMRQPLNSAAMTSALPATAASTDPAVEAPAEAPVVETMAAAETPTHPMTSTEVPSPSDHLQPSLPRLWSVTQTLSRLSRLLLPR